MNKSKYSFFDKIIVLIALMFAVALFLGIIAGVSDPRKHIYIAFFGLAYPYSLVANFIFLLYWLLRKKWILSFLTILIIGYGYSSGKATFNFGGSEGNGTKAENSIRIMTYNVHSFKAFGENNTQPVRTKMFQVVKDQNPDIICFQEFFTRPKGAYNTIDSLKSLLNLDHYYFLPVLKNDYESYGLAIFSKYPIKNTGVINFDSSLSENSSIYADVAVNGKILRIYNVHFQSISFEKQDYDYLDKVKAMKTDVQPTKRILRMLKSAFLKRSEQVDLMKAEMATCKTPYLIAGDFNDTPASYAVTQITKGLNNSFIKKGAGWGKTYNGKFPNFQIDYIATTKDLDVVNYHITEAKLSDHFPVRVDLKWKP
ncbi:endonuclease [Pedobacter changchengzhani]|uniref:Endonuclease n=1 Tax=Pedobacter changchengzhani TaxID=2529274 RepID=A0A4R5MI33_9SPHI|nr:endonuclease/exonuclease/phosphatase family protein [Pedobacter changchengzhani]TDG35208.1 endonuclease [Pedobacter changchengzhani]